MDPRARRWMTAMKTTPTASCRAPEVRLLCWLFFLCPLQMLTADGFDDAQIGILRRAGQTDILIYSYQRCVEILQERENWTEEEAEEWMDTNVVCTWMGDGTPGFLMNE